jgi:inorganic triphosphatase YgiF
VTQLHLCAYYVDTPDRRLAAAGMALRLRRENRRWVQTLKGRGDGMFSRFEQDVVVPAPAPGRAPVIDLNRFAGTPAGAALQAALGEDTTPMQVLFTTDVRRTLRLVRCGKSVVEVAFDEGELRAGPASWPLCELEFELKSGTLDELVLLAGRWLRRFNLWLDVRTKADRGDQLARGLALGPVVHAPGDGLRLEKGVTGDAALRRMAADCLAHLLPNAAEVARGDDSVALAGHLHQTRVALRRLRTALAMFGGSTAAHASWQPQLQVLFAGLGATRDRDAFEGGLLPALQAAGAPAMALPPLPAASGAAGALRSQDCNALLLELIRYAFGQPLAASPPLKSVAAGKLRHLHRQLRDDAAAFAQMDDATRHRVRRRLKRFRYSLELVASLWPQKRVGRVLAAVRPAQQLLGELNDLVVAQRLFETMPEKDAGCWFALGWIAARRERLLTPAAGALLNLADARGFWRGQVRKA